MNPYQMSNDELAAVLQEYLSRQQTVSPVGSREFPRDMDTGSAARGFDATDLASLRPYVVSIRQGQWDTSGIFNSTKGDVDALFSEHAKAAIEKLDAGKKFKIVLYAHGGLVSESHGLTQAQAHIDWWKQSAADGIYPIYFVWKTGLGETIAQLLGLGGGASRDLAGTDRAWISDPVVAGIARRLGGESVWAGMKHDAEMAMLDDGVDHLGKPQGVAAYVAEKLKQFCDQYPNRVELHAIGHSAGAVFHSHFIPLCKKKGIQDFTSTNFMAPAVRVDTFLDNLTDQSAPLPAVGKLTLFTMKKDFEKQDNCIEIYHQSLLYLIYHALETVDKTPILGLEECLRGDQTLAKVMGLGGAKPTSAEVIWSKTDTSDGCSASQAIHHGDFSSDAASLNSILRRILQRCNGEPIHPFPGPRGLGDIWNIWAPPDDLPGFHLNLSGPTSSQPITLVAPAVAPAPFTKSNSSGNRKALCVGIDAYASPNTLSGCVNDANNWARLFRDAHFEVQTLLNQDSAYDKLVAALQNLVRNSKAGDILVFQYSGHGTTVPDQTGRTSNGIEEAMVPADFSASNPKLLMDFDLAAIFTQLPAGVNLTCFIDCCHSQTILRMFGRDPQSSRGSDEKARFMTLSPTEVAEVQQYQRSQGGAGGAFRSATFGAGTFGATTRGDVFGGQERMLEVAFAACAPNESAYEVNGQGDFTRLATDIIRKAGITNMNNQQFQDAVTAAFGANPRQHPNLDCASTAKSRAFLMPL